MLGIGLQATLMSQLLDCTGAEMIYCHSSVYLMITEGKAIRQGAIPATSRVPPTTGNHRHYVMILTLPPGRIRRFGA
jgi:hypothetical protein